MRAKLREQQHHRPPNETLGKTTNMYDVPTRANKIITQETEFNDQALKQKKGGKYRSRYRTSYNSVFLLSSISGVPVSYQ